MTSSGISLFEKLPHNVCVMCAFKSVYAHSMCMCVCTCVHMGTFACVCMDMGEGGEHILCCSVGGQRITWWNWFSPSIMWVPGIKFKSPGLLASTFICWAILKVLKVFFTYQQHKVGEYIHIYIIYMPNNKTTNNNWSCHIYMKIKLCRQWKDIINKNQTL